MITILLLLIIMISILRMICLKKAYTFPAIICISTSILLLINIVGIIIDKSETVTNTVIDKISSIPWDNEEYLKKVGFFEDNEEKTVLKYFSDVGPNDKNIGDMEHSFFHIYVEKMDKEHAIKEYHLQEKSNLLLYYQKENGYRNILSNFLSRADTTSRMYGIYSNNRFIFVREHNNKTSDKLFEQFIMDL